MAKTVAIYVRVSTSEQSLDRQLEETSEYIKHRLDVELSQVEVYRDKSTGTNTERSGYQELMSDLESGEIDHIVSTDLSRVARSLRDLDRTTRRVAENGATIHIIEEDLRFGSDASLEDELLLKIIGAITEWWAKQQRRKTRAGIAARQTEDNYHHGRPPLGFETENGELVEGENYEKVCAALGAVQDGELSKRAAADELDCSRATIRNALERPGLYGL